MRTPVVIVAGQHDTDDIAGVLLARAGTALVEHRFDGNVVHRRTTTVQRGVDVVAVAVLELTNCCLSCTVRNDLLEHLRLLHRRTSTASPSAWGSGWSPNRCASH
jgi:G3E family GTPase